MKETPSDVEVMPGSYHYPEGEPPTKITRPGPEMDRAVCERLAIQRKSEASHGLPDLYHAVSTDPTLRYLLEEALLKRGLWPLVVVTARGVYSACLQDVDDPGEEAILSRAHPGSHVYSLVATPIRTFFSPGPTPSAAICAAVLAMPEDTP